MVNQLMPPELDRAVRPGLRVTSKALPQDNRVNNRSLVLQMLFDTEALSRADIARASGLTRATVSVLVNELVSEGMLIELGASAGTGVGKPGILVGLNADAFHMVALDLSADDRFIGAVINLRGVILYRTEAVVAGATGEEAFELVVRLAETVAAQTDHRILGLGVGTPGIVARGGVIEEAPHLGWYGFPLATRLSERFGYPVSVGNDANAAALGVHTFRETGGRDLIVVNLEHGAGAGLIIGGSLIEGAQFAAGEIGHVMVDEDGELCVCGRRGCLELSISAPNVRKRLAAAEPEGRHAVLSGAGRMLGIALSPVVSALNVNRVVLRGPVDIIGGALLDSARETVHERTMSAVSDRLDMGMVEDGADLVLLGAAVLVLSSLIGVS